MAPEETSLEAAAHAMTLTRRNFAAAAAAMGAAVAVAGGRAHASKLDPRERRDLYPQGVASADPKPDSVILWTRRPPSPDGEARRLNVEVARDPEFKAVVARGAASIGPETDWTCRFLAARLRAGKVYWYRFVDEHGNASRTGRTITAPAPHEDRTVRFAFVSCQLIAEGACNAYRRMIFEDAAKPAGERLDFVLHLGDFIYEVIWYPEDHPGGVRRGRRLRDLFRFPQGRKIGTFWMPASLDDYREVYKAYLQDPDLQDARARWPFVCVWDNHEFSWQGWQSQQILGGETVPSQKLRVAANQAWWEFIPARVEKPGDPATDRFVAPEVSDAPLTEFDDHGLGLEENNLAAIGTLRIYRTLRYGRNMELFLTDHHSYRSDPSGGDEFTPQGFRWASSQTAAEILDAGRAYDGGNPPETIRFDGKDLPNPRKDASPASFLGAEQKAWFLKRLGASEARWKVWGHSFGTLDWRADYQNLPEPLRRGWPDDGYNLMNGGYYFEKGQIFDFVRDRGIAGFAIVAGDRHSFWAGYPSKSLPPKAFEPVGVEFITGSISSPGLFEVAEHVVPKDYPRRALLVQDGPGGAPLPAMNMTALHGVRSALELARTGDVSAALALHNPDAAPHLKFVDLGGHGYSTVEVDSAAMRTEFVCIPRPYERDERPDGGPLSYRVAHTARLWAPGGRPELEQEILEGTPPLST